MTSDRKLMSLDDYPIDEDYIGTERKRADITPRPSDEEERESDLPPSYTEKGVDRSYMFLNDGTGGSGTEWDGAIDREAPTEHDGRALTRTGFDPSEATGRYARTVTREGKKWKYARWLSTLNDGFRSNEYKGNTDKAMIERWVATFCSSLDLTVAQRELVEAVIDDIKLDEMAHYTSEATILSVISLVANADDRWIRDEDTFRWMVYDVGYTMEDVKNCRQLIKRKTELL